MILQGGNARRQSGAFPLQPCERQFELHGLVQMELEPVGERTRLRHGELVGRGADAPLSLGELVRGCSASS